MFSSSHLERARNAAAVVALKAQPCVVANSASLSRLYSDHCSIQVVQGPISRIIHKYNSHVTFLFDGMHLFR